MMNLDSAKSPRHSATLVLPGQYLIAQIETHHFLLPLDTFTLSKPFFALNSSTAASASGCLQAGAMVVALVCQYQKRPLRNTMSWGTKYTTAAIRHLAIKPSMRIDKV